MEAGVLSSLKFEFSDDDDDDFKYLRDISTILVAAIQEVKDRVSQIESMFCSQLFPHFQLIRAKGLRRRLAAVEKTAEDELKKKENLLMHQIEELLQHKECAAEQIQLLTSALEESKMQLMTKEKLVEDLSCEKKLLLDEVESFINKEELIGKLKEQLEQKTCVADGLQKQLLEQVELRDQMLSAEKVKKTELLEDYNKLKATYKQLKSQYVHIYRKLDVENEDHVDTTKQVVDSPRFHGSKRYLEGSEVKDEVNKLAFMPSVAKVCTPNEKCLTTVDFGPSKRSSTDFGIEVNHITDDAKPKSISVLRKTNRNWIDTRVRQGTQDGDPHDDFLDTPMELVRNFKKGPLQEAHDIEVPPQDMDFGNSDDETQNLNTKSTLQQQISISDPTKKVFKYVEPVRKKAQRENLKGVQCQQCKKFYDAVLPDGKRKNNDTDMHCEHHDGVSRHRYSYAPPMTPDGFWNIGFDSEV